MGEVGSKDGIIKCKYLLTKGRESKISKNDDVVYEQPLSVKMKNVRNYPTMLMQDLYINAMGSKGYYCVFTEKVKSRILVLSCTL